MSLGRSSAIMVDDYHFIFITNEQKVKRLFLKPQKNTFQLNKPNNLTNINFFLLFTTNGFGRFVKNAVFLSNADLSHSMNLNCNKIVCSKFMFKYYFRFQNNILD